MGCIPTKAWVQTARSIRPARSSEVRVNVSEPQLDFGQAVEWKNGVVKQMTGGVAGLFKSNGVDWVKGRGTFTGPNTIAVEAREDVTFKARSSPRARSRFCRRSRARQPSLRRLDQAARPDRGAAPARRARRRHHRREFASIFQRFGSEVTIVEMLDTLIPQEDADAAKELAKAFGKQGIALQLGKQCNRVEDDGNQLRVHFGEGENVEADLVLVSIGRGPLVEGLGLEAIGVQLDKRAGILADEHRRTTVPHIYAVGDCAGYWQLANMREGEVAAENACGHEATIGDPAVPRPIYTDPEIAGVGLTRPGTPAATTTLRSACSRGRERPRRHAGETVGWVKSITRRGLCSCSASSWSART